MRVSSRLLSLSGISLPFLISSKTFLNPCFFPLSRTARSAPSLALRRNLLTSFATSFPVCLALHVLPSVATKNHHYFVPLSYATLRQVLRPFAIPLFVKTPPFPPPPLTPPSIFPAAGWVQVSHFRLHASTTYNLFLVKKWLSALLFTVTPCL